jgi:hypothetical protein
MRLALASLIVLGGFTEAAFAQDMAAPAPAAPAPVAQPPAAAAPATTPSTMAPSMMAPTPAPVEAAPAPPPAAPVAPPAPPAAPTDPAAIAIIAAIDSVCVRAVDGGDLNKLTKAAGFHKSGDTGYVMKGKGFQITILPPGSNPSQCHLDIIHPVYTEGTAAPIVVALNNWAGVTRGYSLYRNDKSPAGSPEELTTRSWEHDDGPKHEALVITTFRKADGSPAKGNADTSTVIYSVTKTAG